MTEKGISTREETKKAILRYLSDGETRRSDEIVNNISYSKNTIYKYRAELIEDGLIKAVIGPPRDPRPRYEITELGLGEYEKQKLKRKFSEEIDNMSAEEIKKLIIRLEQVNIGLTETVNAAFTVMKQRKVQEVLDQGRNSITLAELNQPLKDVEREKRRPKVGDLYDYKSLSKKQKRK